jgi:hypothetical protein
MKRQATLPAISLAFCIVVVAGACATSQFDRYLKEGRWTDAAQALAADSSLLNDEHALYAAGVLYGSPGRPTFDPARASDLLRRLLLKFPQSDRRNDAVERLALLDEVVRARHDLEMRERDLTAQIETLTAETRQLRARADSAGAQSDQVRRSTSRLEAELRDRDEQLRALRRELQRLKEIDLKPRPPTRVIKP